MSVVVIAVSRLLLVMLFLPFSALDKIINFDEAMDQASQAVAKRWLARMFIFSGLIVEIGMSIGVLTGVYDRLAAFILGGYCIVTALLWKQFWKAVDFKLKGPSQGRETFWDFLKNFALAGGFFLVTFGGTAANAPVFIHFPLSSTEPYSTLSHR